MTATARDPATGASRLKVSPAAKWLTLNILSRQAVTLDSSPADPLFGEYMYSRMYACLSE